MCYLYFLLMACFLVWGSQLDEHLSLKRDFQTSIAGLFWKASSMYFKHMYMFFDESHCSLGTKPMLSIYFFFLPEIAQGVGVSDLGSKLREQAIFVHFFWTVLKKISKLVCPQAGAFLS